MAGRDKADTRDIELCGFSDPLGSDDRDPGGVGVDVCGAYAFAAT
jgi:hypothetical protein